MSDPQLQAFSFTSVAIDYYPKLSGFSFVMSVPNYNPKLVGFNFNSSPPTTIKTASFNSETTLL
ncbi:MAG: hypothetical protein WC746_05365 [archaeon]|jgi:hypothetical protein